MPHRYLVLTPRGKRTILDPEATAAAEGIGLAAQINQVLGAPPDLPGLPASIEQHLVHSRDGDLMLHHLAEDVLSMVGAQPNPYAQGMLTALSNDTNTIHGTVVFTATTEVGLTDRDCLLLEMVYDNVASQM